MAERNKATEKPPSFGEKLEHSKFVLVLMLLMVLAVSLIVMIIPENDADIHFVAGQYSPYTLFSKLDFSGEDKLKTRALREQVASQAPYYFKIQPEASAQITEHFQDFFAELRKRGNAENKGAKYLPSPGDSAENLAARLNKNTLDCLLQIADNPVQMKKMYSLFESALNNGIISNEQKGSLTWDKHIRIIDAYKRQRDSVPMREIMTPLEAAKSVVNATLEYYNDPNKDAILASIEKTLVSIIGNGNLAYDQDFTEAKKEEMANMVRPVMFEIHKGQPILEKKSVVTDKDLMVLEAYNKELRKTKAQSGPYRVILENIFLCLAIIIFTGIYIYHVHPEMVRSNRTIWLLGLITIASILLNRVFLDLFKIISEQYSIPPNVIYFALPLGFAAIIVSVIYGIRAALFVGLLVTTIASLQMNNPFQMMLTGLIVNGGAGFAVRYATNYRNFFIRAFLGTMISTLIVAFIFLWRDTEGADLCFWILVFPLFTGLLTAILAQLALFVIEFMFDVSTTMSLLIYSDYNHPLLKRLQFEAPGTYHHSLMVSTLAEQAAQEVGLNHIKARVCALFHDVGKLSQPDYFIENSPGADMHRELNPSMSAMIILNHVKYGLELARKYKLKKIIRDTIMQHHGTDLILYFYKRAQEIHGEHNVGENEFRYQGPLPSEKEIVLIMLADCCEAASRSLEKPTPASIDALVKELFRKKIRDGQLDEANLTMKELAGIRKSFVKTLSSMMHGRIAYPKDDSKDEDDLFVESGKNISAPGNGAPEKTV